MIYLIITTSITNKVGSRNVEHRKKRYIDSIKQLLSLINADVSIKPTENLIRPADSHSSGSMTDKYLHPSPEGADLNFQRVKPIIVENNGLRETYLDELSCDVVYTTNNVSNFAHKGVNELLDIKEVINKYNIQDDDIVIKLTGRYKLLELSAGVRAEQTLIEGDSKLVILQSEGKWKVKSDNLKNLNKETRDLLTHFDFVAIRHVYRDNNQ